MKKLLVLTSLFVFAFSLANAQTQPADNTKVAAPKTADKLKKANKQVDTALLGKVALAAGAATAIRSNEGKFGQKIQMQDFNGQPQRFSFKLPAGKKIELAAKEKVFNVQYSKYDYKLNFFTAREGFLTVLITPSTKEEDLIPTATATVALDGQEVRVHLNAVTIDDVNNGLGWGEVVKIGTIK